MVQSATITCVSYGLLSYGLMSYGLLCITSTQEYVWFGGIMLGMFFEPGMFKTASSTDLAYCKSGSMVSKYVVCE